MPSEREIYRVNRKAFFDAILDSIQLRDGNAMLRLAIPKLYGSHIESAKEMHNWIKVFYANNGYVMDDDTAKAIIQTAIDLRNTTVLILNGDIEP